MKAFVTGAAGFVGSRLAGRLLAGGAEVLGLDSFTDYYSPRRKRRNVAPMREHPRFTLVEADLLADGWAHYLDGVDVVFHQAGQPGVRESWDSGFDAYIARNILSTQRLLDVLRARQEQNAGVRRLVYASSSSVYGDAMTFPTHEGLLPAPFSPYGVTKLAGEHLCGVYARNWGIPTISLRYFTVYGGGQRPDMAMQRMIEAALNGSVFPQYGDGSQRRDFTHVNDVVAANLAAAEADVKPGEIVNIAGGSNATVAEVVELVGQLTGRPVEVDKRPTQPGDVMRTGGDTSKARQLLNWKPSVALADGIKEQVAWYQQQAPIS